MNIPQILATVLLAVPGALAGREFSRAEVANLLALQAELKGEATSLPSSVDHSEACSVRLVSLALHYRQDPQRYRNEFFAALVIDDYVDREAGKYNDVEPDDVAAIVDSAMIAPDGIDDSRVKAAIGFCALKDKNLWVETRAGRVSLARVVRGVAIASLLDGADEDAVEIANAVDARTAASHGFHGQ